MNPKEKYKSANAFKMAITEKLRVISRKKGIDVSRLYRQVAYTHLLSRLFKVGDVPWALKGGHALELRIAKISSDKRRRSLTKRS